MRISHTFVPLGDRTLNILFNGESREVNDGRTVGDLLDELDLSPRHVAVEVNLEVVPRQRHYQHVLRDGDRIEVVTLVGGG